MTRHARLEALRVAVEVAAGSMRQVADHLDDVADALPRRYRAHALNLAQQSGRLRAAADLLVAEAAVGDVRNVRRVAAVALAGLLAAGGLLGPAVVEGVGSALVEQALTERDRATACVRVVEKEATPGTRITQGLEVLRAELNNLVAHTVEHAPRSSLRALGRVMDPIHASWPKGREDRAAALDTVLGALIDRVQAKSDGSVDAQSLLSRLRDIRAELSQLRLDADFGEASTVDRVTGALDADG